MLDRLMDGFYSGSSETGQDREWIDSRRVFQGLDLVIPASLRMIYFDEFTTSLLVDFMEETSAFFVALIGWGNAHVLEGVRYGYGDISYYSPQETEQIPTQIAAYPNALLETRFENQAQDFRTAVAGLLQDDLAIIAHQRAFADFLRRFYEEATQAGDFVLLFIV